MELLTCKQALHLGEMREVTREPHAKGDASARGATHSRENARRLWKLLHAYGQFKGEWVNKHIYSLQCYLITFSVQSTFLYSGPRCLDSVGVVWLIFGGWKHCKELHKSRSLMWAQVYYYPGFTKTFWHKLKSYSTFKNILNLCSDLKLLVLLLYKIHFH